MRYYSSKIWTQMTGMNGCALYCVVVRTNGGCAKGSLRYWLREFFTPEAGACPENRRCNLLVSSRSIRTPDLELARSSVSGSHASRGPKDPVGGGNHKFVSGSNTVDSEQCVHWDRRSSRGVQCQERMSVFLNASDRERWQHSVVLGTAQQGCPS